MSKITAEFTVSVTLDVDSEDASKVTMEDLTEMVASAVGHHQSGKGIQLVCGGKCQWDKPYEHGKMKPEDAKFADCYVEAETEVGFEVTDYDDEFIHFWEVR